VLSLKNVQAGYGQVTVIWDVSLEVKAGEIVSLIGSNGAGKTTLLKTISGVVECQGGSITFEGVHHLRGGGGPEKGAPRHRRPGDHPGPRGAADHR